MPIFGSVCFGIIQYDPLQEIKFNNDKNVIHLSSGYKRYLL